MNPAMSPTPPEARHSLQPRHVKFDWQDTPLQWLPGDPFANHTINVLHLLFPAGEMWFCRVYNKALPLVTDPQVHADAKGFMRQEAIHARSHEGVLKHYYAAHGIDTTPFTKKIDRLFSHYLGEKPFGLNIGKSRFWVRQQLGTIAALEHFFGYLGQWVLDAKGLDEAQADPMMLDLLRWHGAEEVEHRMVAHSLFTHLGGNYLERVLHMLLVMGLLLSMIYQGNRFMMKLDPAGPKAGGFLRTWHASAKAGRLPHLWHVISAGARYFSPWFSPGNEGNTEQALAYLANSPAASRAQHGGNFQR
jgi:predicted metal-dependent hydrolase